MTTLTDVEREALGEGGWHTLAELHTAVEHIVTARVAEAVERERAAWVARIEAHARGFAHPCEYHVRDVRDCAVCAAYAVDAAWQETLRALLSADDTEALAAAKEEAWDEGWVAGADDQKSWNMDTPGFRGAQTNPYRA